MFKAWIDFIISIIKAIFKLKNDGNQEQQQQLQQQQQHLQEHQQNLQNQYDKIDEQHQINPNPSLQEVKNKLNDRF